MKEKEVFIIDQNTIVFEDGCIKISTPFDNDRTKLDEYLARQNQAWFEKMRNSKKSVQ